jgi:glycosyltransferase involved in cell wall biosynthesis
MRLTLVGSRGFTATDPPSRYERTVRRRAAALGSRVSIRPFLPPAEVAHILASSDVLVVPSRWPEPFALTVREGQAAGMAVVAADVGGIPEALGPAGVLVPPDDPRALADVLAGLADDERWLRRLGASARAFAVEHDWSAASTALGRAVAELTRA